MSWFKLVLVLLVPLLVSVYTINFGRWVLQKENKFGGVCTIGFGVIAFLVPLFVYISKQ